MAEAPKKEAATEASDVAWVYGRSEDGRSYGVLRKKNDQVQMGTLRPLEDGKPIHGELVKLRPRSESQALFDVETQHSATRAPRAPGPSKVATPAYRSGWDSIWANKRPGKTLN
ncbi:MAG: hypothetical protein AAF500_17365 [Myxococcota bacterium]